MRLWGAIGILAALVAVPAWADPMDRLFSTPQLSLLGDERPISYRHVRRSSLESPINGDLDRVIDLARGAGGTHVDVTITSGDAVRRLNPFRGMTGNPILMIFLESVVHAVSEASGGSPFYLRNRIKEAIRERSSDNAITVSYGGSEVPAQEIRLRPFEGDAHAAELGPFADLELGFVLSEAIPGTFLSLSASARREGATGFAEEIRLDGTR